MQRPFDTDRWDGGIPDTVFQVDELQFGGKLHSIQFSRAVPRRTGTGGAKLELISN